jgi:hypothetical protein
MKEYLVVEKEWLRETFREICYTNNESICDKKYDCLKCVPGNMRIEPLPVIAQFSERMKNGIEAMTKLFFNKDGYFRWKFDSIDYYDEATELSNILNDISKAEGSENEITI